MDTNPYLIWAPHLDFFAAIIGYLTLFFGACFLLEWVWENSETIKDIRSSLQSGNYKKVLLYVVITGICLAWLLFPAWAHWL